MEKIKGIKVNGVQYQTDITKIGSFMTSPNNTEFELKVDDKGGVFGYKAGVNEGFPYSDNESTGDSADNLNGTVLTLTDVNMKSGSSARVYDATIEDGKFKVTEKKGFVLQKVTPATNSLVKLDPIIKQTLPLMINQIYVNNRQESVSNPNHDTTLPVSHNFIEIANYNTEKDINLDNVYLQYFDASTDKFSVLKLKGSIKPFSTYLIRGAQIAPMKADSTIIKVDSFDIEWYDDDNNLKAFDNKNGAFYLTLESRPFHEIGLGLTGSATNPAAKIVKDDSNSSIPDTYIDLVGWGSQKKCTEIASFTNVGDDIMIVRRNMFDRASQANPKELVNRTNTSSSVKFLDVVYIDKTYIGNEVAYKPMASWEGKNLYTTRSDFRENRPYCVSVSFGIDAETTRCFNWISPGNKKEYLFYRTKGATEWIVKESYSKGDGQDDVLRCYHNDADPTKRLYIDTYDRKHWETSGNRFMTTHKVIIKNNVTTDIFGNKTPLTSGLTYYTDKNLTTASETETEFTKGKEYEYCVGAAEYNRYGEIVGPKEGECSDICYFQVRTKVTNKSWSFIQHSDEQGFHWMEYEVWRRVANIMRLQFNPQFTIDTGDMTQSGNRMNEWIDYNVGIEALAQGKEFSGFLGAPTTASKTSQGTLYRNQSAGVEQMNIVGNNDLAPVKDYDMSTGNEATDISNIEGGKGGKCSPHQFSYFYCYELDLENLPAIFETKDGVQTVKHIIPSCYSYNYNNCHFIAMCSEITPVFAKAVLGYENPEQDKNPNDAIQEWAQKDLDKWYRYSESNYPKKNDPSVANLYPWVICYMHEMPYTILVQSVASTKRTKTNREGSKLNTNVSKAYSTSEMFQRNHVRLVIGGHKHTHSQSWPILENVSYDGQKSWELTKEEVASKASLRDFNSLRPYLIIPKSETAFFEKIKTAYNTSGTTTTSDGIDLPGRIKHNCVLALDKKDVTTAPIYVMSQASANKVVSNKDVATPSIPWLKYYYPGTIAASVTDKEATGTTNTAIDGQKYPHFVEYVFKPNSSNPMGAGSIEIKHWAVNKEKFANFQTSQVFFNVSATPDGQREFTDPLATPATMTDITKTRMPNELGAELVWTDDFELDFEVFE